VFADTPAKQNIYNEYYRWLSNYEDLELATGSGTSRLDMERLEAVATVIQRFLPDASSSVLDVGCANGGLLRTLGKKGYTSLMGIDPSAACVRHVQTLGIRCVAGDIFSSSFDQVKEKFDCITLTHVMEHIYDLKNAVERISATLKENGILYIEVPDASRYAEFYTVPYYYIDCEHINHFDANSLENLFVSRNFSLPEIRNISFSIAETKRYPAVYGVFQKRSERKTGRIKFSDQAKNSFVLFLDQSKLHCENDKVIQQLVRTQHPIVIWGAGQFTLRLLANSSLSQCNIQAFIDSDSNKQGRTLAGVLVHSPEFIRNNDSIVVICSALHAKEIEKTVNSLNSKLTTYILK